MNALYDAIRPRFLNAGFDWASTSVVLTGWVGAYVFNPAHTVSADVAANGGTSLFTITLANKTVSAQGYAKSDRVLIAGNVLTVGQLVQFFTLHRNAPPFELIAFINDAVFLPFTANGLEWLITPDFLDGRGWFRA